MFIERVWQGVKYEEVYLKAYESAGPAQPSVGDSLSLYNRRQPHSRLEDCTPDEANFAICEKNKAFLGKALFFNEIPQDFGGDEGIRTLDAVFGRMLP